MKKDDEIREWRMRRADCIGRLIACGLGLIGLTWMLIYCLS